MLRGHKCIAKYHYDGREGDLDDPLEVEGAGNELESNVSGPDPFDSASEESLGTGGCSS